MENFTIIKNFNLYIEIPDMPIADQKLCGVFFNNLEEKLRENNLLFDLQFLYSKDLWQIFGTFSSNFLSTKIKGPKRDSSSEKFFREKYPNGSFFYDKNFLYVEITDSNIGSFLKKVILELLKKHSCSIKMSWSNSDLDFCRPIRNIYILFNGKQEFLELNLISQEKKEYLSILTPEEKLQKLYKESIKYDYNKNFLEEKLIYLYNNPKILIGDFDSKYLEIPEKIISSFLENELLIILLFENGKPINKFLCLLESNIQENIDGFQFAVNAKLTDLFLQFEKDKTKSIKDYKIQRDNKIINEKLGTLGDKIQRMEKIFQSILKNRNKDSSDDFMSSEKIEEIYNQISLFSLDISSEIVSENPALLNSITEFLIPGYTPSNFVTLLDYIDNLIEMAKLDLLPTGNKDQFGLKKQCDFIIFYLLDNYLDIDFELAEDFVNHRLKNHLAKINPILNFVFIDRKYVYEYLNFDISLENLQRVINLEKKSICKENIEIHSIEKNLLNKINNIHKLYEISEILEEIISYINTTTIQPYIERKDILTKFISKIHSRIDIRGLSEVYS